MAEEFISIVDLENIVRVRISDETLKFIEQTQQAMKLNITGMNCEATIQFKDFDSMEPIDFLTLRIEKYKWEVGYYDYDGFEDLKWEKDMVPYKWFHGCEPRLWRHRSKDKNRWKSDAINFLTGEERLEIVKNARYRGD